MRSLIYSTAFLLALVACDDDTGGGSSGTDAAIADGGRLLADGPLPDFAPDGPIPDAAPDGSVGDGPLPDAAPTVDDCADACSVYGACERLDLFGDEAACLDACGRAAREGSPDEWFACLEAVECADIETCVIPEVVELDCDAVCATVEMCDAGALFPDCAEACPQARGIASCAETLAEGVCDTDGFRRCLGTNVYPECGRVCAQAAECNIFEEAMCLDECIEVARGDDPLAHRRSEQRAECVASSANDCFRINQCVDPNAVFGLGNTCIEACQGLQECGVVAADALQQCLGECEANLEMDPEGYQFIIDCTVEFLVPAQCSPEAFMNCLGLEPPTRPAPCVALCEARNLCERDEGMGEMVCVQACQEGRLAGGGGLWGLQVPCGRETTCEAFGECLDAADPEAGCAAHCGVLDVCELGDEACPDACAEDFGRARNRAERDCVEAAGEDCEAMAECEQPEPPPCADYCARVAECDLEAQMNVDPPPDPPPEAPDPAACIAECDDQHFADPELGLSRVACVLGAPVCDPANPFQPEHAVSACRFDPAVGEPFSRACLAWCTARLPCAGDDGDLAACVRDCGDGLEGADALRFAAASECLLEAEGCDALIACIPEEVEVDCDEFCETVDGCGVGAEACAADCADAPDADAAGCVLDATTRRRGCARIAECVGFEADDPSPACAALCDAQAACDVEIDIFRCGLGCTPPPEGLGIRAACAELAECADIDDCTGLDADPSDDCVEACGGVEPCGGNVAECAAICTGREASGAAGGDYAGDAAECLEGLEDGCEAADALACFELASDCEAGCQLLSDCNPLGIVGTPAECVALMCPDGQIGDFFVLNIECALRIYVDGACDEEAFLACLGGM